MSQPKWKLKTATEDFAVFEDETGEYEAEMEVAQNTGEVIETEEGEEKVFLVYRFSLDRLKRVRGKVSNKLFVVPAKWDKSWPHPLPDYEEWFIKSLKEVASFVSSSVNDLIAAFCSKNVMDRAGAYEAIGSYHGFENLDSYPQTMPESKLNARWS